MSPRLYTSFVVVLALTVVGLSASAGEADPKKLRKLFEGVSPDLEMAAANLRAVGIAEQSAHMSMNAELRSAAEAARRMNRESSNFTVAHDAITANLEDVAKKLSASHQRSGKIVSDAASHYQKRMKKVTEMVKEVKDVDSLVARSLKRLQARPAVAASDKSTVAALFRSLEARFPKWTGDIKKLERKEHKEIEYLSASCAEGVACTESFDADVESALERLQKYDKLVDRLRQSYGDELAHEIDSFVSRHPQRLLTAIKVVGNWYADYAESMHEKFDTLEQRISFIEQHCCTSSPANAAQ